MTRLPDVRLGGRRHRERGAALVEFAVVSIVFFTFVFGVTEFGRMIFDYNLISTSVRDGARWAAVRGNNSGHPASAAQIQAYVVGRALGRLEMSDVTVSWLDSTCSTAAATTPPNISGNCVSITAQHNFASSITTIIPFASIPLHSTTSMVISR